MINNNNIQIYINKINNTFSLLDIDKQLVRDNQLETNLTDIDQYYIFLIKNFINDITIFKNKTIINYINKYYETIKDNVNELINLFELDDLNKYNYFYNIYKIKYISNIEHTKYIANKIYYYFNNNNKNSLSVNINLTCININKTPINDLDTSDNISHRNYLFIHRVKHDENNSYNYYFIRNEPIYKNNNYYCRNSVRKQLIILMDNFKVLNNNNKNNYYYIDSIVSQGLQNNENINIPNCLVNINNLCTAWSTYLNMILLLNKNEKFNNIVEYLNNLNSNDNLKRYKLYKMIIFIYIFINDKIYNNINNLNIKIKNIIENSNYNNSLNSLNILNKHINNVINNCYNIDNDIYINKHLCNDISYKHINCNENDNLYIDYNNCIKYKKQCNIDCNKNSDKNIDNKSKNSDNNVLSFSDSDSDSD